MQPIKALKNIFSSKSSFPSADVQDELIWQSGLSSAYEHYKKNDYENAYPSINKIVQAFASVEPYMIDSRGEKVQESAIMQALYSPNNRMSSYNFREALMLLFLLHDEVPIQVHYKDRRNGYIVPESITGFTFIENRKPTIINNRRVYYTLGGEQIADDEVIVLYSPNPYAIYYGYSASRASRRWARLDDYIADYQTGFFKNGAVPAGQFIITAKTVDEFRQIKTHMQRYHRGAQNNNNVMYAHRPIDPNTGNMQTSNIEWVPFNITNKDMSLSDIFQQANEKVDSAYGVPQEVRGKVHNSNLASAQIAQRVFIDNTVRPLTMKVWDTFTHELARVTNGFGAAITFDLPSPSIAEEDESMANRKQIEAQTIVLLRNAGYTTDSIVAAMGLDPKYAELDEAVAVEEEVEHAVEETGEPDDAPEVDLDNALRRIVEADNLITKETHSHESKISKVLDPSIRERYEKEIESIAKSQMNKLAEKAAENVKSAQLEEPDNDSEFAERLLTALTPLVAVYGRRELAAGQALILEAGLDASNMPTELILNDAQRQAYREYLQKVAVNHNDYTAQRIRSLIADGVEQGLTNQQIAASLRQLPELEAYHARRLAVSEVNRAGNRASLVSMEDIQQSTGYEIRKIWRTTGAAPCEFCTALNGTTVDVSQSFLPLGETLIGSDGGVLKNDFVSMETADGHPYCQCVMEYKVG